MALDRTAGYDMLVQISETELNNQLATQFLAGGVFPPMMVVPVNNGGLVGTASLNYGTPIADLDRARGSMGITLPFSNSQLQVTAPMAATIAPLGGTILIVDTIAMLTEGSNQICTMDFAAGAPTVTVLFDAASQAVLAGPLALAGLTLAQAQNLMAGSVVTTLQNDIGRIDLTPPIPVLDDSDATTIFDMDVTTVNDLSAADRDCLTFGVKMANDSGGNLNGVTTSMIPGGSTSLVMMSNFWLLAKVMRPRVAAAIGTTVASFDTPLRLNRSIPAPGGTGTLRELEARVIGNRIRVDGRATASGTGWSAESNFTFFIDIALASGAITITATTPSVDTDVDLEWWVWLASLGIGALFGGIIGAIIAAIVLAIVEAVAEGVVNGLVSGGIGGALSGIPSIPLGPIGGGLTLAAVVLDDLELRGTIIRSVSVPVKDAGSRISAAGFTVDLDSGDVGTATLAGTDLIWDPARGIVANGPTGLTITGGSYGSLGPVEISRLPMAQYQVPLGQIPMSFSSTWPFFFGHDEVVFGVRTTEGRYAKCRAWRDLMQNAALHLDWVTYDTPTAKLDIAARWSIVERGEVTEYFTPNCEYCTSSPVRRVGVFEAWPRLMAFPIDYQWCLCGHVIQEGNGTVNSPNGPLDYTLVGRRLTIETDMGQTVECELCVSAIDARGLELFTCIQLSQPGIDIKCKKCVPSKIHRVDIVPAAVELAGWRPVLAEHGMAAVRE